MESLGAIEVADDVIEVTHLGCLYADSFLRVFYPPEFLAMDEVSVGTPAFDTFDGDSMGGSKLVALIRERDVAATP